MRNRAWIAAAGLLLVATGVAAAQSSAPDAQQAPMRFRDRFAAANTSHNGCLTQQEAEAGGIPAVARNFAMIDTAHRGCVTMQDIAAFNRARRAGQPPGTAGPAGPQIGGYPPPGPGSAPPPNQPPPPSYGGGQ